MGLLGLGELAAFGQRMSVGLKGGHMGLLGLGELAALGQVPFEYTKIGRNWARVRQFKGGRMRTGYMPLWKARRIAGEAGPRPTGAQRRAAQRAAQRAEGKAWWGDPATGKVGIGRKPPVDPRLGRPVRNIPEWRRYKRDKARAERRGRRREKTRQEKARAKVKRKGEVQERKVRARRRRQDEADRMKKASDNELGRIAKDPNQPGWKRRHAERILARRAYLGGGIIGRGRGPGITVPRGYTSRGHAKPFVFTGTRAAGALPAGWRVQATQAAAIRALQRQQVAARSMAMMGLGDLGDYWTVPWAIPNPITDPFRLEGERFTLETIPSYKSTMAFERGLGGMG